MDDRRTRVLAGSLGVDSVPLYALLFVAIKKGILDLINARKIIFALEKLLDTPRIGL